jgi:octaprenyl-diphosphate synthase
VGQDLKEGKVTLPLIYALKEASASEKRLIESIFKRRRKEDINSILSFIKQKKAIALTEKKAKAFIERAKRALSAFSSHPIKDNLYQLADFVVKRHS